MATTPSEDEPQPTSAERIRKVIAAPVSEKSRATTLLALAAGLATFAPAPLAALAVVLIVIVAVDLGRKR